MKVIAEIGCNHKGDMVIAKQLIDEAVKAGAHVAKFQKRNNRELLSEEQYNAPHPNPVNSYGNTYGEHREFLEFNLEQNKQLKAWCEEEGRISLIEQMLRNALIITEDGTSNAVSLGKTVTFDELINGKRANFEESYTIVGSAEADPIEGKISNDSPIAKALMGKHVDEVVKLTTPGGDMEVVILEIK